MKIKKNTNLEYVSKTMKINYLSFILFLSFVATTNAQDQYIKSSISSAQEENAELSSNTAQYKVMFGEDNSIVKGLKRYAYLNIDPKGRTDEVNNEGEELVYYILQGTGIINYENEDIPISKDDFFYVPANTVHRFLNPREDSLSILLMGFRIPNNIAEKQESDLQIANTNDVSFQPMPGHGATSRFKLLLGETTSTRDKLAAANQVKSLFIIDFDPEGTNIPHVHEDLEEIYFVLEGKGKMVAGKNSAGEDAKYSAKEGDAFFIPRNTSVGFYSENKLGDKHAKILAVRFKLPNQ